MPHKHTGHFHAGHPLDPYIPGKPTIDEGTHRVPINPWPFGKIAHKIKEQQEPVPERANREGDSQALPIKNDRPYIQDQVIADIESRRELGIKRYGTALQPFNGRNALLDTYEELLDACVYLKQKLVEDTANEKAVKAPYEGAPGGVYMIAEMELERFARRTLLKDKYNKPKIRDAAKELIKQLESAGYEIRLP